MSRTLLDELNELHAAYVHAIEEAVAEGELAGAEELAANYGKDVVELVADREGRTRLLPLPRHPKAHGDLRRLIAGTSATG